MNCKRCPTLQTKLTLGQFRSQRRRNAIATRSAKLAAAAPHGPLSRRELNSLLLNDLRRLSGVESLTTNPDRHGACLRGILMMMTSLTFRRRAMTNHQTKECHVHAAHQQNRKLCERAVDKIWRT